MSHLSARYRRLIVALLAFSAIPLFVFFKLPRSLQKASTPKQVKQATQTRPATAESRHFQASTTVDALNNATLSPPKDNPLILYWGAPWGISTYMPPEGSKAGRCTNTRNRDKIEDADMVVFHYTVINKDRYVPWTHYRDPHQIFVWWSAEPPSIIRAENRDLSLYDNDFFNWTWTYRLDADVHRGYGFRGNTIKAVAKGKKAIDDLIAKKEFTALWLASKCGITRGAQERLEYTSRLLQAGLKLDRIGKCFKNQHLLPRNNSQTMRDRIRKTKFYMTFENSLHCTDYVTEKFWENALLNDAVPVVWGASKRDLMRVAPMDSFIHTEDFASPEHLADYLMSLERNETEYRKYFRWREDESMTDERMISMIKEKYPDVAVQTRPKTLCERYLENRERKIIKSIREEFVYNNPEECYELASKGKR